MLLTGGFEAHVALPIKPCVPVPGVYLQDRLEFSIAAIDAALHEGHGTFPYSDAGAVFLLKQFGQYQGAGVLTGLGLLLRHTAQRKRLPFTAVFGRTCLPVLGKFFTIGTSDVLPHRLDQPVPSFYLGQGIFPFGGG